MDGEARSLAASGGANARASNATRLAFDSDYKWVTFIDRRKRNTAANVAIATDWPAGAGLWPWWRISV